MPSRISPIAEARRHGARLSAEIGSEARRSRLAAGMTLSQVAAHLGWSRQRAARFEHGQMRNAAITDASVYLAAVGMKLAARAWPLGAPLRDVAQLSVTQRLLDRCHPAWRPRFEVPLGIPGDLRAFDLLLTRVDREVRVYVEILTRLTDAQAQLRSLHLKWRDGAAGRGRLVIVLADTAANRQAIGPIREILQPHYPIGSRAVLRALGGGHDPGANGIAFL